MFGRAAFMALPDLPNDAKSCLARTRDGVPGLGECCV